MTPSDRRATLRPFILGFVAVAALLVVLLYPRLTRAQDPYPVSATYSTAGSVIASSLNIRTGPHVSYSSVAYLIEGQRVALVGRNVRSTWAQIELPNGFRGWVNARYLQMSVPILFLPVVNQPWSNATGLVTDEGLTIYMGPGWVYRPLALTQPGDVLRLLGRDVRADWYFVALPDGRTGWAPSNGPLLPSVYIQDLPITTPFIDYIPSELADHYQIYIGPAYYYQFFEVVTIGQSVAIIGRNEDGTWLRVRLPDGREGWIDAAVLSLPVPSSMLPPLPEDPATVTPSPTPLPTNPPAKATLIPTATPLPTELPAATATTPATLTPNPTATTTPTNTPEPTDTPLPEPTVTPAPTADTSVPENFYVYPLPDTTTVPIVALAPGQQLGLLGRTADVEWVKVSLVTGETGWVLSSLLQADFDVAALPVVEP